MSEPLRVVTRSGRTYDIDLEGRRFRTTGEQLFITSRGPSPARGPSPDPHHEWNEYKHLSVDDAGRLYIVETGGSWRQSTRVVEGLEALLTALDEPSP